MRKPKPEAPPLPLEEPKPELRGHGETVVDPRRKHKADKRKKHGA